jgi:hypothetical protein
VKPMIIARRNQMKLMRTHHRSLYFMLPLLNSSIIS